VRPGNKLIGFICGLAGARTVARSEEIGPNFLTSRSSDRLDVVHAAAILLLPDPGASGAARRSSRFGNGQAAPCAAISSSRLNDGSAD
jgi:hypothetical protein